jgi:leader peptidase (prepilin peptidase)/N-methyltransferase
LDATPFQPTLLVGGAVLLGLIVGSFLNVVIHRLPLMMEYEERAACAELLGQPATCPTVAFNLWAPRSHCPECRHPIDAADNVPLLSYLLRHGRCRHCQAVIPVRYPLVEAAGGLLAGIVVWQFGYSIQAAAALALTWALLALSVIDLRHLLLPDRITLPFLWLGLLLALFGVFTDLHSSVIGAMVGYLSLWGVYQLFRLLTGKEGMGYGDFKLLAMLGAWLGWQQLLTVVLLSSLVGVVVGVGLTVLRGRDHQLPLPFGPFLAAAGWLALLWGDALTASYLDLAGL